MRFRVKDYEIFLRYNPIWPWGIEWHIYKRQKTEIQV